MPDTPSDAFLQGQGIPVEPGQVETELTKLWGPAAERVGGPDVEHPTVTRVVLANLVVATKADDAERIEGVLDTVVQRYPCRAILLRQTDDPERKVKAEVSARCHLPAPGMPQVCSEGIILDAGPKAIDLLPGAVRAVLESDLPFVLWWARDPRETEAIFLDLGDECTRLILDLPDPGADVEALRLGLNLDVIPYARDIAWFGISRWRELVAQFFDGPACREALGGLTSVEITAEAPSVDADHPPRAAVWLAAWLAGQLGWQAGTRTASPGRLDATFQRPGGEVAITINTTAKAELPFARLTGVSLAARTEEGDSSYRLARPQGDSDEVRVEVDSHHSCLIPRLIHAPTFHAARRMAAALESSRRDPPFRRALPHALWLLGGGKEVRVR